MSTTEAILEKLSALPPAKQEEVLDYVNTLTDAAKPASQPEPGSALRLFANLGLDGPPDSSARFHERLYGENARDSS